MAERHALEWVAVDRRHASLDNRRATRAVVVHADDLTTARTLAVRRLGVRDADRHFVEVGVVTEGESIADAVVRVTRAALQRRERSYTNA